MKQIAAILLLLLSLCGYGQKHDYTWLAGYSSSGGFDSAFNYWFGISKFDFNQQPMEMEYDSFGISFKGANYPISNKDGDLSFYTNNITVRNNNDEIIGDSLHNGFYLNYYPTWYRGGHPMNGLAVVLPNPQTVEQYDMLYVFGDTINDFDLAAKSLMRAHIDMGAQFGKGEVTYKDRPYWTNRPGFGIAATKHANGRDWWVLTMREGTNGYDVMRYDGGEQIHALPIQNVAGFTYSEAGGVHFSPDGSIAVSLNHEQGKIDFYNFDRCSGKLDFIAQGNFPEKMDSPIIYRLLDVEFSPSSRYAYVCANKKIYQYDMLTTNIPASKTTIAEYLPYHQPAPVSYNMAQLAPDGKIYISSYNTTYYMAVINNPDAAGAACNFQDTVKVPSFIKGLPCYPNYRLGTLPGSICDTLTGINDIADKEKLLNIFPNPASDIATIDYGYTDWSKGEVTIELTNNLGQTVHSQSLPMYSGFQKLEVSNYPSGSYTVYIKRKGLVVATGRLVKE